MTVHNLAPWHDTPLCVCGGPVVPFYQPCDATHDPSRLVCAACGLDWFEADPCRVARAWWSRGAWDALCFSEEGRDP